MQEVNLVITLKELSRQLGVSYSTITRWFGHYTLNKWVVKAAVDGRKQTVLLLNDESIPAVKHVMKLHRHLQATYKLEKIIASERGMLEWE